jgi:uncharacterized protein YndB with AHSA1/START domain
MRSPYGQDIWCKGIYREIVPPERIVCTDYFSDEEGNMAEPLNYGIDEGWPSEGVMTVTFRELDGKTTMTVPSGGWRILIRELVSLMLVTAWH